MERNMSLVREQTPYLLTTPTPTTAHTHGILIPVQNFDLFEGFYIKILWSYYFNITQYYFKCVKKFLYF